MPHKELAMLQSARLPRRIALINVTVTRFLNNRLAEVKIGFNTGICLEDAALQDCITVPDDVYANITALTLPVMQCGHYCGKGTSRRCGARDARVLP
jgi:hypothetical protein